MFFVITEEKCVGPLSMEAVREFNPNGLDEFILQVVWSNDQVSFHYIDY